MFEWLRRKKVPVIRSTDTPVFNKHFPLPPERVMYDPAPRRRSSIYDPPPQPVNSGDGFLTGLLIGEALAGNAGSGPAPTPSFDAFQGGSSGGAGGGADWSSSPDPTPSCDTSSSSSYDSSSSFDSSPSCDSGSSFDSGSSGGGFDSGSGGF
jgi:hypothetical protein